MINILLKHTELDLQRDYFIKNTMLHFQKKMVSGTNIATGH